MHETSRVSCANLFAIIDTIFAYSLINGVAQRVRHWARDHRVVQGVGPSPSGDDFWNCFNNYFYLSFMLRHVDFSDIAIMCNRPNNCWKQNLKCFDEPLFSLRLFS